MYTTRRGFPRSSSESRGPRRIHSLLSSRSNPIGGVNLKLRALTDAPAFVNHLQAYSAVSWEDLQQNAGLLVQDSQSVLTPGSVLLALLSIASVAVLVGRRLSEYARRVGLLKAVGGTPALIAATFLVENVVLALVAAAIGIGVGWLTAPLLTNPGAALVGTASAPSLTATNAIEVLGVALVVALAATLVPAVRAARTSTVRALADVGRLPRRHGVQALPEASGANVVRITTRRAPTASGAPQHGKNGRDCHRSCRGCFFPFRGDK